MQIFLFHNETGEFLNEAPADPHPLEPGAFLEPYNSTRIAPPAPEAGQARVFQDGAWTLVPDHRGDVWYRAYGDPVEIAELGDPAERGLVETEPDAPPKYATLAEAKARVIQYATAFEEHVTGPVSLGEKLSYDAKAAAAVAHMASAATPEETALLQAEADQTGESLNELAQRIIDRAAVFRVVAGSIAGLRRATNEALEAVNDPHDYEAVLADAQAQADALATSLGLEPLAWPD